MSIHRTIFNHANRVLDSLSDLSRYYVWNSAMKHRAQGLGNLDSEQIKLVRDFFSPYKSISLAGHIFYTKKTGVFSQYYIPDSLWYAYIDPHFNPRRQAKVMDSKLLYSRMLIGGVKLSIHIR